MTISLKTKVLLIFLLVQSFYVILASTIQECDQLIKSGVEAMYKKEHVRSLELLTEARMLAEKNNWKYQEFLALNNIGANYYNMLDYGEALNNYLEAYKIAIKDLDAKSEMIVLNNIAILYSKEKKFDKAEEYFQKAFSTARENNDSIKIGLYAVNLAIVANEKENIILAEEYINIATKMLTDDSPTTIQAKIVKAENLLLKNEDENARELIQELLPQLNIIEYNEYKIAALLILSRIYENKQDHQAAINYALMALEENKSLENKILIYQRLSHLYRSNNLYDKSFLYRDSVEYAKDSLAILKNNMLFENSQIKFELQNYQNQLLASNNKLHAERRLFIIFCIIAIVFIVFIFWLLRMNSVKYKQRKIIAERNHRIISLELENEKNDKILLEKQLKERETLALLEQEKLKNEIETKNRELVSKALRLANRNELIENILNSLSSIPEVPSNKELIRHIMRLKNDLKENDLEWQNFLTHFEKVNGHFINKLKTNSPDLSANDIRFLCYIYMNLNTKEISSLLNITQEACRKRKERISRKLRAPQDVDLYNYLSKF